MLTDQEKLQKIVAFESLISAKNRKLDETDLELEQIKKRRKEEEADRDSTVNHMCAFIRGEDATLFDNPSGSADSQPNSNEPVKVDYRTVTLKELGLSGGKMGKSLVAAGLTTLAAIGEYTAKGRKLTDLESIGQGKADQIIEACDKWWTAHPPQNDDETIASNAFKMKDEPLPGISSDTAAPAGASDGNDVLPEPKTEDLRSRIHAKEYDNPEAAAASIEAGFNECRSVQVQAIGGANPKVKAIEMADLKNRFGPGLYIVTEKSGNDYTLQRVYEKSAWIERLGQYDKAKEVIGGDGNPKGIMAQATVINIETNVELFISGEDEQFVFVDDSKEATETVPIAG